MDRNKKVFAYHFDSPAPHRTMIKFFLCPLAKNGVFALGTKYGIMDEFNMYMKRKNLIRYRYVINKHYSFLDQLGVCKTSQILDLDRKLDNGKTTLRKIIMSITDKNDNKIFFHLIDPSCKNNLDYFIMFRPDKQDLAIKFRDSLSTYASYLYPDEDLFRVFTYNALVTAKEEAYDPVTQSFEKKTILNLIRNSEKHWI